MESFILRRLQSWLVAVLLLWLAAFVMRPIERACWQLVQSEQAELRMDSLGKSAGQGVVLGVLGGLRSLVADFAWLQLNRYWEARDRVGLNVLIRLVTRIDPRPEFFWINSARMVGYDVPHWRIATAGGHALLSKAEQGRIIKEQANEALALLEQALNYHPNSARLKVEIGQIYLNRLQDYESAAEWFLRASKEKDAPYYVARIYADLLVLQGKTEVAYTFLKELYLSLPDDPMAQADLVLDRICELEVKLELLSDARFREDRE
ncbi:MAG: Uncharacterised protein [Opitutia bacterium UBA7350]|nr:MAG: Uncharacterised protein [Opitutae bacterium UBA7350]